MYINICVYIYAIYITYNNIWYIYTHTHICVYILYIYMVYIRLYIMYIIYIYVCIYNIHITHTHTHTHTHEFASISHIVHIFISFQALILQISSSNLQL